MLAALGFLTPFGPARTPGPRTLRWFPVVGAAVGAVVGLVWWGASKAWRGPLVPAGLAVGADLALTGLLHMDGLADSADGLLPHLGRQRRLAVMAEPDIGAFGLAVTAGVLLLRFAALGAVRPEVGLVAGVWCVSRSLMIAATITLPYARGEGGLASSFLGDGRAQLAVISIAGVGAGVALAVWGRGWPAAPGIAVGILAGCAVLLLAHRRLGGFTGDVLGATAVIAETAALLTAAAKW